MIRKAVIPCAGLGTRMLPFSSAVPKELLPVGTLPVFHYVLCEAATAGVETVVLINAAWKSSLENYLQLEDDLIEALERTGKFNLVEPVLRLRDRLEIVSVRQGKSLGLGHAIACAQPIVGDEPFAVLLPDELILQTPPVLQSLVQASDSENGAIAVIEVPLSEVTRYGIVALDSAPTSIIKDLVEKPALEHAPSRWAIVGRYVFPPGFQAALRDLQPGANGELQLTDAMRKHLERFPLKAVAVHGQRYDTGNPEAYAATWRAYLSNPKPFSDFVERCG